MQKYLAISKLVSNFATLLKRKVRLIADNYLKNSAILGARVRDEAMR